MAQAPQMRSPEDYLAELLATLTALEPARVPLSGAHGLVLAEDVAAALPVPPWTNSAMDGYAVRAAETTGADHAPVLLPVSGDVPAGTAPGPLAPGSAVRIMTGAVLPEGADAVVRVEDTDQQPGQAPLPQAVEIRARARAGLNVRRAGEDVAVGDPVMTAGTVLSAAALSCLASVGRGTVLAHPRPRVAVVSTGAELVDAGAPLAPGSVPDSSGLLLAGLLTEHGARPVALLRAGDTAADLARVLREAATDADLVVTSGGVSAGAFDPLTMLAASPEHGRGTSLSFAKVAMQPGKPQGHGTVRTDDGRQVPVVMLPGNPVSVLVSFTVLVAPALALLSGHGPQEAAASASPVPARAAVGWRTAGERRQYLPVRLVAPPGGRNLPGALGTGAGAPPWVAPVHRLGSGSHLVASLGAAQALAVVEARTPAVEPGQEVGLIPLAAPPRPCPHTPPPHSLKTERPVTDPSQIRLTHLDEAGAAYMVDVTAKQPTVRTASASAFVRCAPQVVAALREGSVPKGDVLAVARVAGIAAAKKVPDLLPLAHVIGVHGCSVDLAVEDAGVRIETTVRTADRTGVEMEALTAATVAGLAVVDMVKGVDRSVSLSEARVTAKSGGRSGDWVRPADGEG